MSLEQWNTHGDWSEDPWFLRPGVGWYEEWRALGLLPDARQMAVEGLKRIFPPEVCRKIREDSSFRLYGPVISLFDAVRFPGLVAPLLELGLDSLVAKPWEDASVLHRLHQRDQHDEAVFEVRVHAALLRAGYTVERVRETPDERTCDFLATKKGRTFEVEVKLLNSPELDRVAEDLNRLLMTRDLTIPGLHLTLRGSESLAEQVLSDAAGVRARLTTIADAYEAVAARLHQELVPGTYAVEEYGSIVASSRQGQGSMTDLTLPDLPEEKKARRVLRIIRRGLTQLPGKHTGVLVVGLFRFAQPFRVEQLASEAAKEVDGYSRCQMIVLCDSLTDADDGSRVRTTRPVFHAFSPRPYRHLRKGELELAKTLASTRMRPAAQLRPARPGDFAVTMPTTRPARSQVSLGTIRGPLQAGQTVTFTFNGRGETSMKVSPAPSSSDNQSTEAPETLSKEASPEPGTE